MEHWKKEVEREFTLLRKIGFSNGEKPTRAVRIATVNEWDPDLETEVMTKVYVSVADIRSDYGDRTEGYFLPGQEEACLKLLEELVQQYEKDKALLHQAYLKRVGRA